MKDVYYKIFVKDRDAVVTQYICTAPFQELDEYRVFREGRIRTIKVGMKPAEDVFGNILSAKGFNGIKNKIECEGSEILHCSIVDCVERTKRYLEAQRDELQPLRPRLAIHRFQNETIQLDPVLNKYYIPSRTFCANCTEEIPGRQYLVINLAGKVAAVEPFIANDPNVVPANAHSKKLLHPECAVKHIKETETELSGIKQSCYEAGDKAEELLNILQDQITYSADFARGAALMFLTCFMKKEV